jgi:hypothetical protein
MLFIVFEEALKIIERLYLSELIKLFKVLLHCSEKFVEFNLFLIKSSIITFIVLVLGNSGVSIMFDKFLSFLSALYSTRLSL